MNRLKELRLHHNITLRELSDYVDIRNATISNIENGKQPMREIHVQKLTSFFDVTSDYLLGYSANGIGIYFASAEDDDDHVYISKSEYERINERYEIKETLIPVNASAWHITTPVEHTTITRCNHEIYRSVDIAKENADISASIRTKLLNEINSFDVRTMEKLLKFIKDYIK